MLVGRLEIDFYLHGCHSLKGKRRIIKSIINKTKSKFNAAVAEVDYQDVHERAKIGIAVISNEKRNLNSQLDHILNYIETLGLAEIVNTEMEC